MGRSVGWCGSHRELRILTGIEIVSGERSPPDSSRRFQAGYTHPTALQPQRGPRSPERPTCFGPTTPKSGTQAGVRLAAIGKGVRRASLLGRIP